jgi:hypothetical protein
MPRLHLNSSPFVLQSCNSTFCILPDQASNFHTKKVQNLAQAICVEGGSAWRALRFPEDRERTIVFLPERQWAESCSLTRDAQASRVAVALAQKRRRPEAVVDVVVVSWENQAHAHWDVWRTPWLGINNISKYRVRLCCAAESGSKGTKTMEKVSDYILIHT